jgi:hypothetical protein
MNSINPTRLPAYIEPCDAECPARILDLLGPTDHEHAVACRARCREDLEHRCRAITSGTRVRLAEPLTFTDGHVGQDFIAETRGRRLAFRDPGSRRLCRISRFRGRTWSVVVETTVHRTTFARRDDLHASDYVS